MIPHLTREIVSILKGKKLKKELDAALSLKLQCDRVGEIAEVLRKAVQKSSLALFRGEIYAFDGRIYQKMEKSAYNASIAAVMREIGVSNGDITAKQSQMRETAFYGVVTKKLDVRKNVICFKNCVLDVYTGKVSKFNKSNHVLYQLDYDYIPDAKCPLWEKFINQMLPNKKVQMVVQEILALPYVDRKQAKIEKMFLFCGKGANGKSVIYDIMNDILGQQNVQTFDLSALVNGDDSKWNIDAINHSMLNYCSEIDKKTICSSRIKSLISGEGVTACQKGQKPYTARDMPFIIGNVNELPHTTDNTYGFFRRIMVIPFSVTIPKGKEDLRLHDKLKEELPGILNWILEGRQRLVKNGYRFTQSKIVNNATYWYERNSNPAVAFVMDEGYSVSPSKPDDEPENITPTELYDRYVQYCKSTLTLVVNSDTFTKTLINKGYRDPKKRYYTLYKTK
ncbi:hypothetical protein DXA95_12415 [Odoribacter sp. OF09-27XD]|nr:phage/plasmid primase, P4 family [Odoribacter sp. OF09-27XD]RHV92602.1 hypothetical protein DXA95_12415 [Odoribacter sp. OF09-27XD]